MTVNLRRRGLLACAGLFAAGPVHAITPNPFTIAAASDLKFALEEVVEEFASFPAGEHDDLVDSATQALLRFRQGGFIRLPSDEEEDMKLPRRYEYY